MHLKSQIYTFIKGVAKSDVKVTSPPNSSKKNNKPPAKKLEEAKNTTENSDNSTSEAVRAIMENTFYKKELQYNNKQPLAKIAKKNTPQITPVTSASKATSSNRTNVVITSPALQAALENESNARGSSSESERSDSDGGDESHKRVVLTPLKPAVQVGNSPVAKPNSYANVLGKFYSRQNSSIVVALESAAGEFEASVSSSLSKLSGKRGKQVAQNAELPADLRVGNYPAKVSNEIKYLSQKEFIVSQLKPRKGKDIRWILIEHKYTVFFEEFFWDEKTVYVFNQYPFNV